MFRYLLRLWVRKAYRWLWFRKWRLARLRRWIGGAIDRLRKRSFPGEPAKVATLEGVFVLESRNAASDSLQCLLAPFDAGGLGVATDPTASDWNRLASAHRSVPVKPLKPSDESGLLKLHFDSVFVPEKSAGATDSRDRQPRESTPQFSGGSTSPSDNNFFPGFLGVRVSGPEAGAVGDFGAGSFASNSANSSPVGGTDSAIGSPSELETPTAIPLPAAPSPTRTPAKPSTPAAKGNGDGATKVTVGPVQKAESVSPSTAPSRPDSTGEPNSTSKSPSTSTSPTTDSPPIPSSVAHTQDRSPTTATNTLSMTFQPSAGVSRGPSSSSGIGYVPNGGSTKLETGQNLSGRSPLKSTLGIQTTTGPSPSSTPTTSPTSVTPGGLLPSNGAAPVPTSTSGAGGAKAFSSPLQFSAPMSNTVPGNPYQNGLSAPSSHDYGSSKLFDEQGNYTVTVTQTGSNATAGFSLVETATVDFSLSEDKNHTDTWSASYRLAYSLTPPGQTLAQTGTATFSNTTSGPSSAFAVDGGAWGGLNGANDANPFSFGLFKYNATQFGVNNNTWTQYTWDETGLGTANYTAIGVDTSTQTASGTDSVSSSSTATWWASDAFGNGFAYHLSGSNALGSVGVNSFSLSVSGSDSLTSDYTSTAGYSASYGTGSASYTAAQASSFNSLTTLSGSPATQSYTVSQSGYYGSSETFSGTDSFSLAATGTQANSTTGSDSYAGGLGGYGGYNLTGAGGFNTAQNNGQDTLTYSASGFSSASSSLSLGYNSGGNGQYSVTGTSGVSYNASLDAGDLYSNQAGTAAPTVTATSAWDRYSYSDSGSSSLQATAGYTSSPGPNASSWGYSIRDSYSSSYSVGGSDTNVTSTATASYTETGSLSYSSWERTTNTVTGTTDTTADTSSYTLWGDDDYTASSNSGYSVSYTPSGTATLTSATASSGYSGRDTAHATTVQIESSTRTNATDANDFTTFRTTYTASETSGYTWSGKGNALQTPTATSAFGDVTVTQTSDSGFNWLRNRWDAKPGQRLTSTLTETGNYHSSDTYSASASSTGTLSGTYDGYTGTNSGDDYYALWETLAPGAGQSSGGTTGSSSYGNSGSNSSSYSNSGTYSTGSTGSTIQPTTSARLWETNTQTYTGAYSGSDRSGLYGSTSLYHYAGWDSSSFSYTNGENGTPAPSQPTAPGSTYSLTAYGNGSLTHSQTVDNTWASATLTARTITSTEQGFGKSTNSISESYSASQGYFPSIAPKEYSPNFTFPVAVSAAVTRTASAANVYSLTASQAYTTNAAGLRSGSDTFSLGSTDSYTVSEHAAGSSTQTNSTMANVTSSYWATIDSSNSYTLSTTNTASFSWASSLPTGNQAVSTTQIGMDSQTRKLGYADNRLGSGGYGGPQGDPTRTYLETDAGSTSSTVSSTLSRSFAASYTPTTTSYSFGVADATASVSMTDNQTVSGTHSYSPDNTSGNLYTQNVARWQSNSYHETSSLSPSAGPNRSTTGTASETHSTQTTNGSSYLTAGHAGGSTATWWTSDWTSTQHRSTLTGGFTSQTATITGGSTSTSTASISGSLTSGLVWNSTGNTASAAESYTLTSTVVPNSLGTTASRYVSGWKNDYNTQMSTSTDLSRLARGSQTQAYTASHTYFRSDTSFTPSAQSASSTLTALDRTEWSSVSQTFAEFDYNLPNLRTAWSTSTGTNSETESGVGSTRTASYSTTRTMTADAMGDSTTAQPPQHTYYTHNESESDSSSLTGTGSTDTTTASVQSSVSDYFFINGVQIPWSYVSTSVSNGKTTQAVAGGQTVSLNQSATTHSEYRSYLGGIGSWEAKWTDAWMYHTITRGSDGKLVDSGVQQGQLVTQSLYVTGQYSVGSEASNFISFTSEFLHAALDAGLQAFAVALLSVACPPAGYALAVGLAALGAYQGYSVGRALYGGLTGTDPDTGKELSGEDLSRFWGGAFGGLVGAYLGTKLGMRIGQFIKGERCGIFKSCFVAGTPLLTPEGSKPIEEFRVGDRVLSRNERDAGGPVEAKVVEEVFRRFAKIWELRIGGRLIETTGEHPFYTLGEGWKPCGELKPGEKLLGRDGSELAVEGVRETAGWKSVFNVRVADWHTYFVGGADWGWAAWAHNAYEVEFQKWKRGEPIDKPLPDGSAPSWKTVQSRYWKNRYEASKNSGEFSAANLRRMNRGSAPQDYNPRTGQWESRELHHVIPQRSTVNNNPINLRELTPDQHAQVDPSRIVPGVPPIRGIR